jgi:hypothetical protein
LAEIVLLPERAGRNFGNAIALPPVTVGADIDRFAAKFRRKSEQKIAFTEN